MNLMRKMYVFVFKLDELDDLDEEIYIYIYIYVCVLFCIVLYCLVLFCTVVLIFYELLPQTLN